MAQITAAAVAKFVKAGVPEGKHHVSLRDGHGLVLRLLPTGRASWLFVYRMPGEGRAGRQQTILIGHWPVVDVPMAKRQAAGLKGKVMSGVDPIAEKKEAARREKTRLPIALDDYEQWLLSRKLVKVTDMMSGLRRGFQPLMRKTLDEIDRRDMVKAIERIEHSGRPGTAADFRRLASAFLNQQATLGTIRASPLAGYRRPKPARDAIAEAELAGKALTPDEIVKVWHAAEAIGGSFGGAVRLILLTGLRRNEAANLRWSWIDRQAGLITIPAKAMKAGLEHIVVVSDLVAHLLDATPDRAGGLVFPGRALGGQKPMNGWGRCLTHLRQLSGVADIGLHDLRRTFRTVLADLGVEEAVGEMMIAHKRADLVRRYNRASLIEQRRRAAATYDAWLSGLLGLGDDDVGNVVRLPRQEP